MPRSPVQFQKGQSLAEFTDRYGSEEQCRAALFQARWPQGFECPECGRKRCCRLRCRNVFQCTRCRHQVSLTAGTVFANTKLPLRRWFLAMYLLTQSKNGLSAMALGRQLGVSYNTAWSLKHKLMQVIERPAGPHRAGGRCLPGGRNPRRQTRTRGGGQDAVAAVQVTEEGRPVALRMSCVKGFRKQEIAAWAHRHLRRETVVYSDGLACFRGVEEAGCEHRPRVTGGGPGSCEAPGLGWVNTVLGNVKRALDGTYHAWGQKYAPRYLAEFSYRFNRRYQLADLVPRLAHVAVQTPPLPYRLLTVAGTYA